MLMKFADILSNSARYEVLFEKEARVQKAMTDLYLEVSQFLHCLQSTISRSCEQLSNSKLIDVFS